MFENIQGEGDLKHLRGMSSEHVCLSPSLVYCILGERQNLCVNTVFSLEGGEIGGWGGEIEVAPTGKSFRFVRACGRAARARDQLRSPRGF